MKNLSNRNKYVDILWKPVLFISLYVIVALTTGGILIYNLNLNLVSDISTALTILFVPVYLIVGWYFGKCAANIFKASKTELVVSGLLYSLYPVLLLLMDASLIGHVQGIAGENNIFILPAIVLLGIASFVVGGALAGFPVKKVAKKK